MGCVLPLLWSRRATDEGPSLLLPLNLISVPSRPLPRPRCEVFALPPQALRLPLENKDPSGICKGASSSPGRDGCEAVYHRHSHTLLSSSCLANFGRCTFFADFNHLSQSHAQVQSHSLIYIQTPTEHMTFHWELWRTGAEGGWARQRCSCRT